MKFRWKYQISSMVSFVFIGIVMALVFAGAIYFVNQRTQQAREAQEIASGDAATKKPITKSDESTDKSLETGTNDNQSGNNSSETNTTDSTTELPATGAGLELGNMLAVGGLTVAAAEYILSRYRKSQLLSL